MIIKSPIVSRALMLIQIMSIPLVLYLVFFALRVTGRQPAAEAGMGEFITAVYFIFGASVTYMNFAIDTYDGRTGKFVPRIWWWLSSALLLLLAFDEIYMIHENVNIAFGVGELTVFIFYGTVLCLLLLWNRQALTSGFLFCFTGFVVLSGIAVVADFFLSEGLVTIFGTEIGYEQLAESMSALFLSSGFLILARAHLRDE